MQSSISCWHLLRYIIFFYCFFLLILAPTTRYYFDSSTGKCKPFQYSGCGSNANNFQTIQSCQAICGFLGVQGTLLCPPELNRNLNCYLSHSDACNFNFLFT